MYDERKPNENAESTKRNLYAIFALALLSVLLLVTVNSGIIRDVVFMLEQGLTMDENSRFPGQKEIVQRPLNRLRLGASYSLIVLGQLIGMVGLALVSNQFGNTATYGIPVVGLGATVLSFGIASLSLKFRYAFIIRIAAAPASVALLFVLYMMLMIL